MSSSSSSSSSSAIPSQCGGIASASTSSVDAKVSSSLDSKGRDVPSIAIDRVIAFIQANGLPADSKYIAYDADFRQTLTGMYHSSSFMRTLGAGYTMTSPTYLQPMWFSKLMSAIIKVLVNIDNLIHIADATSLCRCLADETDGCIGFCKGVFSRLNNVKIINWPRNVIDINEVDLRVMDEESSDSELPDATDIFTDDVLGSPAFRSVVQLVGIVLEQIAKYVHTKAVDAGITIRYAIKITRAHANYGKLPYQYDVRFSLDHDAFRAWMHQKVQSVDIKAGLDTDIVMQQLSLDKVVTIAQVRTPVVLPRRAFDVADIQSCRDHKLVDAWNRDFGNYYVTKFGTPPCIAFDIKLIIQNGENRRDVNVIGLDVVCYTVP